MADLLHIFSLWAEATWGMIVDSALLLLISFVLAGLLSLVLNARNIAHLVSGSRLAQVIKTALVGIPLPLCSCSVLPVAWQLRRAGVSKGGTASFLISTPESGVDSIMLTWSLMDPMMTVARPMAAFLTAMAAGGLESLFPDRKNDVEPATQGGGCCDTCCAEPVEQEVADRSGPGLLQRARGAIRYAFTDLLNDLAVYLVIGYALAGVVAVIFGNDMLSLPAVLTSGWGAYLGAVVIGVPLYICATSSTPLAAALLVAGFSPGAVLVFLLVGPATNVASLAVVGRILKGWSLFRYLTAIVVVAILCGLAVDFLYASLGIEALFRAGKEHAPGLLEIAAGIILVVLLLNAVGRKVVRRFTATPQSAASEAS